MNKSEMLQALRKQGIVAVVRGQNLIEGTGIAESCIAGGLKAIEVTYTNPQASTIIQNLLQAHVEHSDVLIGAGTVLDDVTARMAIMAGAGFIVSPSFDQATARLCNRYAIPYIPGCMSVQEIVKALEAGCEMIKLFPAHHLGTDYIKALKDPLPQTSFMVTGGVSLNSLADWFQAGAEVVGVGGQLNRLGAKGEMDAVIQLAQDYVQAVNQARE